MNELVRSDHRMERIATLDVLRGFSLLGILIINMISFHSPYSYYNPYEWWEYSDLTLFAWLDVFVQASFYPIFALMFGYGMAIMYRRSTIRGTSFYNISVRRLTVLLFIGMIHASLVWYGDILITYALMGLVLLLFIRLSGPILIGIGTGLYLIPQLFISSMLLISVLFDTVALNEFTDIAGLKRAEVIYATGSFLQVTAQRIHDWKTLNLTSGFILYFFLILPMMMIGAGAGKLMWLERAKENWKKWLLVVLIALPVGIAAKMIPFLKEQSLSLQYVQDVIGGPILGIAYTAMIVLLMMSDKVANILRPIGSAGRMSISIYLSQSLIGTIIFYGYGFGLYGYITLETGTWLAVALYVVQVVFAHIWLSKYRYGPVEKLWRLLTYGENMK